MNAEALTIEVSGTADHVIVRCAGRLISMSSARFQHEVKRLLPAARSITVDLSEVSFMDSMGLGTIAALYVSARARNCEFHLVNLAPRVRELFSVTHLLSLFEPAGESNVPIT